MEKHAVSRLVGAPPGYVGYEEGGILTEAVRRKPYSVVLFDEIEKAHPDVFNILLQVLDDGRLTDNKGVVVDFCNTIIILTSNIASDKIMELSDMVADSTALKECRQKDVQKAVQESVNIELKKYFKPEFLNRIDDIVIFNPLGKAQVAQIVDIMFESIAKIATQKNIRISLTQSAKELIAEIGFDAVFGARPLKRALQMEVEDKLSEMILRDEVGEDSSVEFNAKDGKIVAKVK